MLPIGLEVNERLARSDRRVVLIAVIGLLMSCLALVGIGFVLGKLDNNLPICERTVTIRDGANVEHTFILECK